MQCQLHSLQVYVFARIFTDFQGVRNCHKIYGISMSSQEVYGLFFHCSYEKASHKVPKNVQNAINNVIIDLSLASALLVSETNPTK